MWPPILFERRSRLLQIVFAVVMPLGFGVLCGYVLGASSLGFNGLMLVGTVGGVGAGFEHVGARSGALRGLVGGVCFAGALLGTFVVRGIPALMQLPLSLPLMTALYACSSVPLGALGGWLRGRQPAQA